MRRERNEAHPALEFALLGLLREGSLHGYELHRRLSEAEGLGLVWSVKQAQLYAILERLRRRRLLEAELVPQAGKPSRKIFRLSEAGAAAFRDWYEAPTPQREFKLEFLAKLALALRAGSEEARRILEIQRLHSAEWLGELERRSGGATGFERLVYRYRAGQVEATLAWLGECASAVADAPRG